MADEVDAECVVWIFFFQDLKGPSRFYFLEILKSCFNNVAVCIKALGDLCPCALASVKELCESSCGKAWPCHSLIDGYVWHTNLKIVFFLK